MPLPNAPRRGKDDQRPDHFAYAKLDHGDELYGYLAGPVLWVELHQSDYGSKPCLEKLTGGELSCPKCKYGPPVQKGACPFWLVEDHRPYMLWLDDGRREIYDALPWARKLKFAREKLKGAPVWANLCFNQEPLFKSQHPLRQRPVDITRTLLRMWKLPELDLWYAQTHGGSDSPVSLPAGTAVTDDGRPYTPAMQAAAKRFGADVVPPSDGGAGPGHVGGALDKALDRAKRAERNGKH